MATLQPAPARSSLATKLRSHNVAWPVAYAMIAILIYVFYQWIYPGLDGGVQTGIRNWLPMTSVNEALVWVIAALGLNIVVGYAGLLDLGFVAFWAIGGYVVGWVMSTFAEKWHANFNFLGYKPATAKVTYPGIHLSFWLVLIVAAAVCALFGLIIGAPTLRLRSDYLALVTLGFGEIIPQVFTNGDKFFGVNISNGTQGISPLDPIQVGSTNLGPGDLTTKFIIYVVLAVLIVFISLRLRHGRLGRAWLALREDELAAGAMGVPLMKTKLASYAVGAVAGGIAGVAYATHINAVIPDTFKFSISITLLAMVVLGGMGNVWGVILGAFVVAWFNSTGLPQIGASINSGLGTNFNFSNLAFMIFGIALVLMMLFRREGFLPEARTRLVLREPGRTEAEALGADMEAPAPELDIAVHAASEGEEVR